MDPYDEIAEIYSERNLHANEAVRAARRHFIARLPDGGRVIDLGCGNGRDLSYFGHKGFQCVGIDSSKKLCSIAAASATTAEVLHLDMRAMKFPNGSFDGAWSSASLHHLKRIELPGVIQKIAELLKHGGVFFASLKRGEGEGFEVDSYTKSKGIYVARYEQEELGEVLSASGFIELEFSVDQQWVSFFATKAREDDIDGS